MNSDTQKRRATDNKNRCEFFPITGIKIISLLFRDNNGATVVITAIWACAVEELLLMAIRTFGD